MKFLFRSAYGEALAIARRVAAEGHDVRLFIADSKMKRVGDGMVEKTTDPKSFGWADVIVFDSHSKGLSAEAEQWRARKPVFGSSALADELEHKRLFGIKTMEDLGISVPDFQAFKGPKAFDEAREYIESSDSDNGWVLKPNVDEIRTRLMQDTEEALRMLPVFERMFKEEKKTPDFLLEWRLKGIEIEAEGWFNGEEFFFPNATIEEQRSLDGDLGPLTGCQGNVVWAYRSLDAPLMATVLPLAETLRGRYRGPIAVNSLVLPDGDPVFLEFSCRFGYSAIFAFLELIDDVGAALAQVANGEEVTEEPRTDVFSIGLLAAVPPYPQSGDTLGLPVLGFEPQIIDRHISPRDLRINDAGEVETTGDLGIVFEFTQTGETIAAARDAMYRTAQSVRVSDMGYRLDIGVTAEDDYNKLVSQGVVEPMRKRSKPLPWESAA